MLAFPCRGQNSQIASASVISEYGNAGPFGLPPSPWIRAWCWNKDLGAADSLIILCTPVRLDGVKIVGWSQKYYGFCDNLAAFRLDSLKTTR